MLKSEGIGTGKFSATFSQPQTQNQINFNNQNTTESDINQDASYIRTNIEIGSNFLFKNGFTPYLKYTISSLSYSNVDTNENDQSLNQNNFGFNNQIQQENERELENTKVQSINLGIAYRF